MKDISKGKETNKGEYVHVARVERKEVNALSLFSYFHDMLEAILPLHFRDLKSAWRGEVYWQITYSCSMLKSELELELLVPT